jgi:hypothetical protein
MTNNTNTGVSVLAANDFKSTPDSRKRLIDMLSYDERKMFKRFVQSVENGSKGF